MIARVAQYLPLIAVIGLSTLPAHAQDEFTQKEARQRFLEGSALMTEGKYEQARAKLIQAYAAGSRPNVVFNLARSEHFTGRYLEASRHYREYLRTVDPKKVSARERSDIDGWLRETFAMIGRLEITAPAGAHLLVDGERSGDAPLAEPVDVARGRHLVVAEANGKKLSADVDATAGIITKVTLIDDHVVGDPITSPPIEPERPSAARWIVPGALAVAGLTAMGFGVGFHFAATSSRDDAERLRAPGLCNPGGPSCTDYGSKRDAADSRSVWSKVTWVGGGVFLAGAAVTYVVWPKSGSARGRASSSQTAHFMPVLMPGFAGSALSGSF